MAYKSVAIYLQIQGHENPYIVRKFGGTTGEVNRMALRYRSMSLERFLSNHPKYAIFFPEDRDVNFAIIIGGNNMYNMDCNHYFDNTCITFEQSIGGKDYHNDIINIECDADSECFSNPYISRYNEDKEPSSYEAKIQLSISNIREDLTNEGIWLPNIGYLFGNGHDKVSAFKDLRRKFNILFEKYTAFREYINSTIAIDDIGKN